MMAKVLLVGESEILHEIRHKGFDTFHMTSRHSDAPAFRRLLETEGNEVTWLDTESAGESFPDTPEAFAAFDVVILSDVGANTLLLPRAVHHGIPQTNRLAVLRDWVAQGGALLMCGGWMSFAGMQGAAHYHRTPVETALPVGILPHDDRVEEPQGIRPTVEQPGHDVLEGVVGTDPAGSPEPWPPLLGFNSVTADETADVVLSVGEEPLLVLGEFGRGRAGAWTSDIAPHWMSQEFAAWPGLAPLFGNIIRWLARERSPR